VIRKHVGVLGVLTGEDGGREGQRGFYKRGLVGGDGSVVTQQSYRHD